MKLQGKDLVVEGGSGCSPAGGYQKRFPKGAIFRKVSRSAKNNDKQNQRKKVFWEHPLLYETGCCPSVGSVGSRLGAAKAGERGPGRRWKTCQQIINIVTGFRRSAGMHS